MRMNFLIYRLATIKYMNMEYFEHTKTAMRATYFPWISTNIVQKLTNEPYFGQPYRMFNAGKMRIAVLGAYGGYKEEKTKQISMVNLVTRSEEHTSELQSRFDLVCRLLLEKKRKKRKIDIQ